MSGSFTANLVIPGDGPSIKNRNLAGGMMIAFSGKAEADRENKSRPITANGGDEIRLVHNTSDIAADTGIVPA
jgi:hypothetical protein